MGDVYFLPSLDDLTKAGIVYEVVEQKPGDVVYSHYMTIHWVVAPVGFLYKSI
jgi:hypothetical protein